MKVRACLATALVVFWAWVGDLSAGDTIDFQPAAPFLKMPAGLTLGPCSGVDVDSRGNVYVIQRKSPPVLCFDSSGRLVDSWGTKLIGRDPNMQGAHGIRVVNDRYVWITDRDRHLVRKFDRTGQLLLTLGTEGISGTGPNQFNRPADVAIGRSGEVYVADGYGNSRVMKFDSKVLQIDNRGGIVKSWGMKAEDLGLKPAQKVVPAIPNPGGLRFVPHLLAIDAQGNLYLADVSNQMLHKLNRILSRKE